uniref:Uncharacterized protein n=1 Tax=Knipowitschia caucasica TaxID=637954 RepID=A0AAV2LEP1_KNICA
MTEKFLLFRSSPPALPGAGYAASLHCPFKFGCGFLGVCLFCVCCGPMVVFIIPQQLWWVGLPWLKAQCTFCSPHTFSLLAVTELGSSSWYEDLRLCSLLCTANHPAL